MKFSNRTDYLHYLNRLIKIQFGNRGRRKMCLKYDLSEALVSKFLNGKRPARSTERRLLKILNVKVVRDGFEVVDRSIPK